MKNILCFIRWQWNKWETWQKFYILGAFLFGMAAVLPQPYSHFVGSIPVIMLFLTVGKWWIWDPLQSAYSEFKNERQNLFEVIKNSDKP
jgi:hypothetical protein